MFRSLFLPVGLMAAVATAIFFPGGAALIPEHPSIELLVILIFLVSGYQVDVRAYPLDRRLPLLLTAAVLSSLFLAPVAGFCLSTLLSLQPSVAMGMIIMASVPPTLSSGVVITGISGGNMALALLLTMLLNLTGVFTIPPVTAFFLQNLGAADLDKTATLIRLFMLVALPFATGHGLRRVLNLSRNFSRMGYISSTCVILVVYMVAGASHDRITGLTPTHALFILGVASLFHLLLLSLNYLIGSLLRCGSEEKKAFVFVCSQKTLPLTLAVLSTAAGVDSGLAVIVCLAIHFVQLMIDSLIGSLWHSRAAS